MITDIVLTIVQAFDVSLPWKQTITIFLVIGVTASTLTITGAFNYITNKSKFWFSVAQFMSNITVWFFLAGLVTLRASVMLNG